MESIACTSARACSARADTMRGAVWSIVLAWQLDQDFGVVGAVRVQAFVPDADHCE